MSDKDTVLGQYPEAVCTKLPRSKNFPNHWVVRVGDRQIGHPGSTFTAWRTAAQELAGEQVEPTVKLESSVRGALDQLLISMRASVAALEQIIAASAH